MDPFAWTEPENFDKLNLNAYMNSLQKLYYKP